MAGVAAGGLLGALVGSGVSKDHAELYIEGLRRRGSLLTVRIDDVGLPGVVTVLDKNAVDPASRHAEYAASGWSAFDPDGPLLTEADMDRAERAGSN